MTERYKNMGVKQLLKYCHGGSILLQMAERTFCFLYFLFVARFDLIVFVINLSPPPIRFYHLNTELIYLLFFSRSSKYAETSAIYMSWRIFTFFVPLIARISGFIPKAGAQIEQYATDRSSSCTLGLAFLSSVCTPAHAYTRTFGFTINRQFPTKNQ